MKIASYIIFLFGGIVLIIYIFFLEELPPVFIKYYWILPLVFLLCFIILKTLEKMKK